MNDSDLLQISESKKINLDCLKEIPVFKPLIEEEEISAATHSLKQGWLGMGKSVGKFEAAVKEFLEIENKHVVAVSTGHAALHLSLMLIGLKPGDEVITPSFNNIADFQAIIATGAHPVFCDICIDTLCIDVAKLEPLIGPRTKAIIVTDYACMVSDHDKIQALAKKHNLRVIHDAAHSFGSYYKGKKVGSFSDITMFSFDPVKTMTCIDGGILVVDTEEEVKRLHQMRLIGMGQSADLMYENKRAWTYDVERLGFRYHMANLHGAIGLAQLKKMSAITSSRQTACQDYNTLLKSIDQIITPKSDFSHVTPFLYYIRVKDSFRDSLREFFKKNRVDTGVHWQPGHFFSLFKQAKCGDLSVTEQIASEILSLPLHSSMDSSDVRKIAKLIETFFDSI